MINGCSEHIAETTFLDSEHKSSVGFCKEKKKNDFFSPPYTLNNKCANRMIIMKSWGQDECNFYVCTRVFCDFGSKPAPTLLFSNPRMISVRAAPTTEAAETLQDYLMNASRWKELKKVACGRVEVHFVQRLSVLIMIKDSLLRCTEVI